MQEKASGFLLVCLLLLVALFAYAPIFAIDFFWQLKLGEIIAIEHTIPRTDLFSAVHPERTYVQFQWLWELLAYGAYALHGLWGVRLFQVATLCASFSLLIVVSVYLLGGRALALAFCALALVLFEDRFQARPSATALGFLALILPLLVDERLREHKRAWLFTLFAACLWSNIHSGESVLMPLCFAALFVGSTLAWKVDGRARAAALRDGKLLLASCVGVALSPVFFAGLSDWTRAVGPQLATGNREWLPSYTMLDYGFTPSHVLIGLGPTLVAFVYGLVEWRRARAARVAARPWAEWLLCAGLLVLAHQAVRNAFLCLVPLCFLLMRLPRLPSPRTGFLTMFLGATLLLAAFHDHVIVGYGGVAEAADILSHDLLPSTFPEELAAFMQEAKIEGGVLNDGRWGGYLIWKLWPLCHVFVDSRHDLTAEMWRIFLDSDVAHTRPAAMEEAFVRYGVELTAFRGPTFPAVIASPNWRLLYKGGDQELYQHVAGVHARQNHERARLWLQRRTATPINDDNYASIATQLGAEAWLASPTQRRLQTKARRLMQSAHAEDVREGMFIASELQFDSGNYRAAYDSLARLIALPEPSAVALYRYAFSAFVLGESARAGWALSQLRSRVSELSNAQIGRLVVLEKQLTGHM